MHGAAPTSQGDQNRDELHEPKVFEDDWRTGLLADDGRVPRTGSTRFFNAGALPFGQDLNTRAGEALTSQPRCVCSVAGAAALDAVLGELFELIGMCVVHGNSGNRIAKCSNPLPESADQPARPFYVATS